MSAKENQRWGSNFGGPAYGTWPSTGIAATSHPIPCSPTWEPFSQPESRAATGGHLAVVELLCQHVDVSKPCDGDSVHYERV
jgi:hypothetical protein